MSQSNPPPVVESGDTLRTIPEAAAQLSLSRGYIYHLVERGELTIVKFGRAARVRQSAIDRLIQTGSDSPVQHLSDGPEDLTTSHMTAQSPVASGGRSNITLGLHLLRLGVDAVTVMVPQNADLIDLAGMGALDAVIAALDRGDVPCAMERLDAAILLAAQPLAPPTTGHAVKQRSNLLQVAKSCRKVMRLGTKETGGVA